ncbi:tripartite tricarboxylate transporter substrate binding protein [uncultured Pseudacidovorax sp.]|uniref:Bug family tripartite tricarboxylate transporter substrate binding protein n=1 Tax=uncultured Pseudacidovorax sp. TaxID=679313 RepID=UPI0025CFAA8B|nr:tripartite tricarboxylate transporter substrate binding protein [uncultured Pseudacidovorax sp.]
MLNRREALAGVAASLATPVVTAASNLPDILRIVMPFPAGGALDGMTRIFADSYQKVTGRTCIVDNKPGAATTIGASEVSRGRPDGSVVLWTTGGHLTNGVLMKKLPYHPIDGFTPLTMVYSTYGFALLHRADGPFNSVAEFIAAAKKQPGKFSYASAGNGNTTHVVGALFARQAGIELIHVPYKGTPLTDLISGVVDVSFIAPSSVMQYIEARKIKALAITGSQRADTLPTVPTFAELGMPEIDVPAWIGMLAPPRMPADTLAALYDGVARTLADADFKSRMVAFGNQVSGMPPERFKTYLQQEYARYQRILPPLGIEMDA